MSRGTGEGVASRDDGERALEALWVEQGGCDPETGKAWLTPRMERQAHKMTAEALAESTAEVQRLRGVYDELIYAVGNRYKDETRHETALRYIRQAESHDSAPGRAALTPPAADTTPEPEHTDDR